MPVGAVLVGVFVVVLVGVLLVVVVGVVAEVVLAGGGEVKVGPAEAEKPTAPALVCRRAGGFAA